MIPLYIIAFVLPLLLALVLTPKVIVFANKIGATDAPDPRKVHKTVMPRIGGMAVFMSVAITVFALSLIFRDFLPYLFDGNHSAIIVIICFLCLFGLGFWDDIKPLTPFVKFGVQLIIAVVIYFAGFKISNVTNPLGMGVFDVGLFDLPITVLWIVGITNAFNLIDGLDGLASGVAVIACTSIFVITVMSGQVEAAVFALIVAGALVGFLRYNFNPAKIFLGDSGSLTIGFALALLSIQSTAKISTGFTVLLPILILLLPITDTLISMVRRLIGSFLHRDPDKPTQSIRRRLNGMFAPDKYHIHHQLLSLGFTHRRAVLVLYMVSAFFAFSAFLFTQIDSLQRSVTIALSLGLILVFCIKKLRYYEMAIFNNGLMMPFFEKWVLKRSQWNIFADILFVFISYSLSYYLVSQVNPVVAQDLSYTLILLTMLPIQLIVFKLTGLYREKINQFGLGSALHIIASIGSAVGLTGIVLLFLEYLPLMETIQFLIFDFYFLLTFLVGYRVGYQALRFWFNRDKPSGKNILIYGAGDNGALALQSILNAPNNNLKVVGFLDDDPGLEGKLIYGYPILGGHWSLPKTHTSHNIESIYLCDDNIPCENLKRIQQIAYQNKISIKKINISFHDIYTSNVEEGPVFNHFNLEVSGNEH
ncbi:MAG: hypothetical protein LAT57_12615 [Balneolales bacterium]|nr:hypothetical protein [Balneolales bacterium]